MYQHYPSAPPPPSTEISNLKKANLIENLSEAQANSDPRNMHSWNLLGGLGSHDLSAMRDVIGMPKKCLMATRSDEGNGTGSWWSVLFDYGGFKCYYEVRLLFQCGVGFFLSLECRCVTITCPILGAWLA